VHVAEKYDVRRFMRFNTTVEGARWDEDAQVWRLALAGGETLSTQYLIVATGFLCQPKVPDIPGIETFGGRIVHTAVWDDDFSATGRRAAVIGTGSTGVQVVPELAKEVAELTVYQRTPIWVLPKFDVKFFPLVQQLFAKFPATQRALRWYTDAILEWSMVITMWKFRYFKVFNKGISQFSRLYRLLLVRNRELSRKLDPDFDFGCKRPTISNDFYRAFTKPHVHLETNGIDRIEPDGIVANDGSKRLIDTLVLATGFDVWEANLPAIEVIGRDGKNLGKWWRETQFQAYQGISMPGFPNFLSMASPYAWVGLSWFNTVEYQMKHMERLFGEMQQRDARTFEVTEDANARFLERMTSLMKDSAFELGNCVGSRSYWFRNHTGKGEAPLFRPTSVRSAVKEQERFPLSDYAIA
jgi:cation diffusion facilitator CzcD-associated flavoprotein CzcO